MNKIQEEIKLTLTGVLVLSPVVSGKYEYNTNRQAKDLKFCKDCNIVT
jgi:hypothetical protein